MCSQQYKNYWKQDAQLSQRDRAAGCVIVFAKSKRLELADNILRTLWVYLQPLWYNRPESLSNSLKKKRKIRAITAFKVIQGHRGRSQSKALCDFILVINSYWHPISYRFRDIATYCSNFAPMRSLWSKTSVTRGRPTNHFCTVR